MALILLKKLCVCKQMLTMAASAPCAHHGCTLNWRVATAVGGPCRRVFRWTGGCRGVWWAVALVEQKQCGGLQTPMGPSRETLLFLKILREETRGKRPEDVEACIMQEVCSEGVHPAPDFQQLLWLLHSRQGHLHWELCSTAFRMMEDIWWAFGLACVTGHLRTLTVFSQLHAKMLCRSPLINILRLGGHSMFALQGGSSCSSSRCVDATDAFDST